MKNKILVLGIAGFTGRHFINYISKENLTTNYEFFGADSVACTAEFQTVVVDLTDYSLVNSLIRDVRPDYIINLAGTYGTEDFVQLLKINVGISQNIMQSCVLNNLSVKNILLLGSAAEYGTSKNLPINEEQKPNPVNLYGISKLYQTEIAIYYFNKHTLNLTIARPFNLLGKGLSNLLSVGSFVSQINKIKESGSISVGNLNSKRDFIDIEDAIDAYWKLLLHGAPGEIYNVCAGYSHSMKEILDILIQASGKRIAIEIKSEMIKANDISDSFGDNLKLKTLFEWKIQNSLENSLNKML